VSSKRCPHCGENTEVEEPVEAESGETVEVVQACSFCTRPIMAIYRVVFRLKEIVPA